MSRKKLGMGNNFIRLGFLTLIFALVLSVAINYLPDMTYAYEVQNNGYGLKVSYDSTQGKLFDIDNMAPGEEYTEIVTVKNAGSDSFKCLLNARSTNKESFLYNSLDFTICEGNANGPVIYDGKLKDLKSTDLCTLTPRKSKTFYMTLGLPAESGDEYQRKTAGFKFIFTAAGIATTQSGKDLKNNSKKK